MIVESRKMHQRQLKFISDSFKGNNRESNEDGILLVAEENYWIFGVLDGVSSAIGAKKAVNYAIKYLKKNHKSFLEEDTMNLSGMLDELNRKLGFTGIEDPFATCSLVYIPRDTSQKIKILSLGDSRVYSVSNQYLLQITVDNKDAIRDNILTKYLGAIDLIIEDFQEIEYIDDEQNLLICSDGFYSVIESNPYNLAELHRVLNLKAIHFIRKGISKIIHGLNKDDASYIFVRWENV